MRRWMGLLATVGALGAAANCSDSSSDDTSTPAEDSGVGTSDGAPTTGGDASADDGGALLDAGGNPDSGGGTDTGVDAPNDSGADASDGAVDAGAGFAFTGPETVVAAPAGFAETSAQLLFVCGTAGCGLFDATTGAARGTLVGVGAQLGGVAYQTEQVDVDGGTLKRDWVSIFNALGTASSSWNPAFHDWGLLALDNCGVCTPEYTDMAAVPPVSPPVGASVYTDKGDGVVTYWRFSPDAGVFQSTTTNSTQLKIDGGAHLPVTATQRFAGGGGLVVAVPAVDGGASGELFVHDRTGAAAVPVGAAGTVPRFVRCADNVCVLTNSGSNDVTVFSWDGAATVTAVGNHAVGMAPLGVDVKKDGTNYVAVVINSGDASYNVVRLDANAAVLSNDNVALSGCTPRHVAFVPGASTFAITCKTENKVIMRAL